MKKIFISLLTVFSLLASTSCDQFLGDNIDPTRLRQTAYPLSFTAAQGAMAFHVSSDVFILSSIFTQQAAGQQLATQTRFYDQYIVTTSDVNNAFSYFYTGALPDLVYTIQQSETDNSPAYAGISRIMQAYMFGIQVDCWGKIPYSEALLGTANPQPKYDDDKTIYESLFTLIDRGVTDLDKTTKLKPGSDDLIYGGDLAKWKRFGNTLKLRLALHYAKVDNGQKLKDIIAASSATTFMNSNGDNFQMAFENVTNRQNPINQFEVSRADQYFPGAFFVNLMNTKIDPRRIAYFTDFPYKSGNYKGAATTDGQSVNFSRIHTYLRGGISSDDRSKGAPAVNATGGIRNDAILYNGVAPVRMLTFAEYNFIRAEAALVYGAAGVAGDFFKAGIQASINDVSNYLPTGVDAAVFATSGATYIAAQTAAAPTRQQILEEKYVALYGVSVEPWTDFRRTGLPAIPTSDAALAQNNTVLPRVLPYPLSELSVNLANVPARPSMAVKDIFWDK